MSDESYCSRQEIRRKQNRQAGCEKEIEKVLAQERQDCLQWTRISQRWSPGNTVPCLQHGNECQHHSNQQAAYQNQYLRGFQRLANSGHARFYSSRSSLGGRRIRGQGVPRSTGMGRDPGNTKAVRITPGSSATVVCRMHTYSILRRCRILRGGQPRAESHAVDRNRPHQGNNPADEGPAKKEVKQEYRERVLFVSRGSNYSRQEIEQHRHADQQHEERQAHQGKKLEQWIYQSRLTPPIQSTGAPPQYTAVSRQFNSRVVTPPAAPHVSAPPYYSTQFHLTVWTPSYVLHKHL